MSVSSRPHVDVNKLCRNTKVVAEALARVVYNLTEKVKNKAKHRWIKLETSFLLSLSCALWHVVFFCCCFPTPRVLLETCRSSLNKWWATKAFLVNYWHYLLLRYYYLLIVPFRFIVYQWVCLYFKSIGAPLGVRLNSFFRSEVTLTQRV